MTDLRLPLPARSPRRFSPATRIVLAPLVAGATVLGVWIFGGLVTDDFLLAMVLTALWFGAAGLGAAATAWRWRQLLAPVLGTFVVVSLAIGAYLAVSTFREVVVNEQVVVARETPGASELARGSFVSRAHTTLGTATIVEQADGTRLLTLTGFETDPGPDLRVYLVPGPGTAVDGAVDLGPLRGNRGNQQYEIPATVDRSTLGGVVIWCRAFSVNFGYATLSAREER